MKYFHIHAFVKLNIPVSSYSTQVKFGSIYLTCFVFGIYYFKLSVKFRRKNQKTEYYYIFWVQQINDQIFILYINLYDLTFEALFFKR